MNFEERIESNKPAIQFDCHPNPLHPILNEILLTLDVTFHIEIIIVHATTALTFRERNNTLVLSYQDFTWLEHRLHTGLAIHYLTTLTFDEESHFQL